MTVPWRSIITSVPVLSIFVAHMAQSWGMYTLLSELPTYMKTALNFDIKQVWIRNFETYWLELERFLVFNFSFITISIWFQFQNKWASASPHLCKWLFATVITHVGDILIRKKHCSITITRKLCNTLGNRKHWICFIIRTRKKTVKCKFEISFCLTAQWGAALCLVVVAYSGCNPVIALLFLNLSVGLLGGVMGGFLVNSIDIAPNHAGVIMVQHRSYIIHATEYNTRLAKQHL